MEVGAHMIAGAQDVIDLFFVQVRLFSIEADLITPLEVVPAALDHLEVRIGRLVIILIASPEILGHNFRARPIERTSHARAPIGFGDLSMAIRAHARVDVAVRSRLTGSSDAHRTGEQGCGKNVRSELHPAACRSPVYASSRRNADETCDASVK